MSTTSWVPGLVLVIAFTFAGCGPALRPPSVSRELLEQEAALQRELLFKTIVGRRVQLQRLYTPLRIANADICAPNVSPVTGISGIDQYSVPAEMRDAARRLYGVADGITVLDVVPESPASDAGLMPGDVVVGAAKGGFMPSGWSWSGLAIPDLVKVIQGAGGGSITLLIRRAGNTFPVTVTPRPGCGYPIELQSNDRFNAYSDGSRIVVFTGLFNHVPDDRELSVIIGHELAHNVLRHVEKMKGNAAAGAAAGLLFDIGLAALGVNTQGLGMRTGAEAGLKAYSQEFESEADYLALYMLARAGFDVSAAPDLFRRIGIQNPGSQVKTYSSTHPSTPERAAAMQQTILEIRNKILRREALLPETLPGETLAVASIQQQSQKAVAVAPAPAPAATPVATTSVGQPVVAYAPATRGGTGTQPVAPAPPATAPGRSFARLYLIKGPVVSNPPQSFTAEFLDTGKASVVLAGPRRLVGDFDLFRLEDSVAAKYQPRLINPDSVEPAAGTDARGFAAFSDRTGIEMECSYSLARATGRGQGICADNQNNIYRIVFE